MITPDDNIILVGFAGTGKTVAGRLLAGRLRRRFVDMDEEIAARLEESIPGIFAHFGEARFRGAERELVEELAQRTGLVIAAGGGSILDKKNREALAASGVLVALRARAETIQQRLAGEEPRPLLAGPDPLARIRELKAARKRIYDEVEYQIQTDELSPAEVVDNIIALVGITGEE